VCCCCTASVPSPWTMRTLHGQLAIIPVR